MSYKSDLIYKIAISRIKRVGVNRVGKTTTIGKLSHQFKKDECKEYLLLKKYSTFAKIFWNENIN